MSPVRAALVAALALALGGCAWSNRDNRPVWNAFEEHLVPENDAAFVATLPLTVPGGLGAILIDSFVVHPVQVVDDAAGDAIDVWKNMEWQERYYTELATLLPRTAGTPIVFLGSFLGRSFFDIDPRKEALSAADLAREREEDRAERRVEVQRWLQGVEAGRQGPLPPACDSCASWSDELQSAFDSARRGANADGRLALYEMAGRNRWPPWRDDPTMGLRDPDPVVRYLVLQRWPQRQPIPDDLQRDLRSDPSEMVRLLAQQRFGAGD